jgi:hypothetical protein
MTRNEQFKQELIELLRKYDAEMVAEEGTWLPVIRVDSRAKYSEDGKTGTSEPIRLIFEDMINGD